MVSENILYGVIAAGLGASAGTLAWAAVPWAKRLRFPLPHRQWRAEDRASFVAALAAVILVSVLTWGWRYAPFAAALAGVSAFALTQYILHWGALSRQLARQREILLLFDTVELYMRAGLSMYHALDAARVLTPNIRAEIGQALMYWPEGASKALEVLRRRLNTPEADILVSLLLQLDQAGIENFQDIVRREGRRLEQLKDAADRARINRRPFLLVLYRALPLLACLGMIAGAFFTHALGVLREAGIM